ncbi:MAG: DNA translocase FtsK [Planctomycetota bacterium]
MTVNTLGGDFTDGRTRAAAWLPPLVPLAIATFAVAALVSYHVRADVLESRSLLQDLIVGIYRLVGFAPSCMFFLVVFAWSTVWFRTGTLERPGAKLGRALGMTLALTIFLNLDGPLAHTGSIGAWIGGRMVSVLGSFLSYLLVLPVVFLLVLLATDFFWVSYFEGLGAPRKARGPEESGVEPDVTEHFKGLSRVFSPRPKAPAAGRPAPGAAAEVVRLDDLEAAIRAAGLGAGAAVAERDERDTVDVAADEDLDDVHEPEADDDALAAEDDAAEDGEEDGEPRLSHFERRQLARLHALADDEADAADVDDEAGHDRAAEDEEVEDAEAEDEAVADEVVRAADAPRAAAAPAAEGDASGAAGPGVADIDDAEIDDEAIDDDARAFDEFAIAAAALDDAAADDDEDLDTEVELVVGADDDDDEVDDADADENLPAEGETDDVEATLRERVTAAAEPADEELADASDASDASDEVDDEPDDASEAADETPRGVLAPLAPPPAGPSIDAAADRASAADTRPAAEPPAAAGPPEPVVSIPRPPEGARQQKLFVGAVDEGLVREAIEVIESTRRASASLLQRKLRIDFEEAKEVLALLAHRGVVELADDGTQGRVLQ